MWGNLAFLVRQSAQTYISLTFSESSAELDLIDEKNYLYSTASLKLEFFGDRAVQLDSRTLFICQV